MYEKFAEKSVKLVYNDGVAENKCDTRYVKGKVIDITKNLLTLRLFESNKLFAVPLSQIVYVKEIGINETRTGG